MPLINEFDPEYSVVEAVRDGDRYAFEELVRRHTEWVRGVVFGVVGDRDRVDDVTQNVWLAVWRRASELREVNRWRPWLYRMARNAAIDAGREVTRRKPVSQPMPAEMVIESKSSTSDGESSEDEGQGDVFKAVASLPAIYREPFVLKHLNGWSYRQIAETMEMPVDTVETRLVRARRLLRETLKKK